MKKIIALVLAALCLFAFISCADNNGNDQTLAEFSQMYKNSNPTKMVSKTTQTFDQHTFESTKVLTIGRVTDAEGTKDAVIYDVLEERFRSVEDGGKDEVIKDIVETVHTITLFVEGKGTKNIDPQTGKAVGAWNSKNSIDIPARGDIAIFLDPNVITSYTYENDTLSFVVAANNTLSVFGKQIDSNVSVSIVKEGIAITGITLQYSAPANKETGVYESVVEISVSYSYDNEPITF